MNNIKLIVTDVDGTLVRQREHTVSPRTQEVIERVHRLGKHIAIASARPVGAVSSLVKELGLHGPQVVDGGASVYDFNSQKLLWQQWLELDVLQRIALAVMPHVQLIDCYPDLRMVTIDEFDISSVVEAAPYVYVELDQQHYPDLQASLGQFPDIAYSIVSYKENLLHVQISHKNGTKEHGVTELQRILGVDRTETMAIGDADNDLPLFAVAGLRVAMGLSSEALLCHATDVTDTVERDGWAQAVEKFVLT